LVIRVHQATTVLPVKQAKLAHEVQMAVLADQVLWVLQDPKVQAVFEVHLV
jgi:hypothetical protein